MYLYFVLIALGLVLTISWCYATRCKRREKFTGGTFNEPICHSDYMTPNPFKFKKDDDTTEFDDEYFNTQFEQALPVNLRSDPDVVTIEGKIIKWINGLSSLNQKSAAGFELYDFYQEDDKLMRFTIYRKGKNHGKVISSNIVKKNDGLIEHMKVIGIRNSYDILSKDLNNSHYDHLRFKSSEDRWQQTEGERLIDLKD